MCLIIIKNLMNNNIIMNDSMSILLATTILALGGLGLYMYKSSDDTQKGGDDVEYDEGSLFSGGFWGLSDDNEKEKIDDELEEDEEEIKPRRKNAAKTQRNRKPTGSSRRRY